MKELDFLEINLSQVVPESVLLDELSRLLQVDRAAMWDWNWPAEAPDYVHTNVSYVVDGELAYPLFLSLNFNQPLEVPVTFEVEVGYALAQRFACSVLVSDPSDSADGLLEVQASGQIMACKLEQDAQGKPVYTPGPSGLYPEVITQLQATLSGRWSNLPTR